ncbi:hypothetical protein J2Y38_001822 [Flavobacterium sp. 2755]|uniref:hypothetical protein n=1 Tax=Flavobacterium sp. 2755 TaxID=2817765 RepID=UPI002855DB68|nr:hypothetical protein [Flavobacterium sp. 2755]MDR6761613.1 hypothetical protein [Flavobacterium sp. 2755]
MRKFYYYLLFTFIITGCDNKEELPSKSQSSKKPTQTYIINGDIEYISEITDGSKPKKPIFIYDIPNNLNKNQTLRNKTAQNQEKTVITFDYGIAGSTKSGCFINRYNNGNSYDTDNGVYGYNPARQENGYLVRGAGLPHHNTYLLWLTCSYVR